MCYGRYASEVDVDFVRKAVRAIGQCAIKLDGAADRCVQCLLELISTKVSYVVQEAVVVLKVRSFLGRVDLIAQRFSHARTSFGNIHINMKG